MPGTISENTQQSGNGGATAPRLRGIYHLTHPRSASNLFQNMMAKQPGFQYSSYMLFEAGFAVLAQLQKGPLSQWPEQEREKLYKVFEAGFEKMQDEVEEAEKNGKQVFMKEHSIFLSAPEKLLSRVYKDDRVAPLVLHERGVAASESAHTNPTSLPDSYLVKFQPIFQIRHPVLMFPSMLRAQMDIKMASRPRDDICQIMLQLRDSRALYDWYAAQSETTQITPRVIDADDIMNDPGSVRKLCVETGLDPDAVVYEWEERVVENPLHARFLSTLSKSKGILKGLDAKGKSVQGEMDKWVEEFGKEEAEELARLVESAMEDYEYLYTKRTVAGKKV